MVCVSVIIPIYNVERYLSDCLESLLHQTLKNIEVLLVNDGTKDNSGIIAKRYAEKYPQIFKYMEKENGGLSDARNYAMPYVKGKYVAFVDSDDFVAPTMFEKLYYLAEANNADMVDCEFDYVYEESGKHKQVSFPVYKNKFDCLITAYPNAWNKLYNVEWLKKQNVKFPKGLWHEDIEFFFKVLPFSNIVPPTVHEPLYYYRQRNGSIMNNPDWRILDLHKIYANIVTFYKENGIYNEYKDVIEYKYLKTTCCNFMRRMLAIKDKKFRDDVIDRSWREFNNAFPNWKNNPYLKQLTPINIYLHCMSRPLIGLLKLIIK